MEKELDYTALGIKIRQTRKKHHVTQEQLGEICELSTAHIGHIERGTRIPSLDTLFRIAQALDVSMDYLVGLTDDPTPPKRTVKKEGAE